MDALGPDSIFLFEGFHLDRRGLFRRDERGNITPVAIGGRALDLLGVLVERQGEILSKAEIMAAVWPKAVVEEGNLTLQISALRRVLGRDCIQTVARRGYRFAAAVTRVEAAASETRASQAAASETRASQGAAAIPQGGRRPLPRLSIVGCPLRTFPATQSRNISPTASPTI
jgi:DNA-binding winged helix-turn-helix (wHTH) protein